MKIGIHAFGTRGDVAPFLALSAGLSAAGHQVTLAITTMHKSNYSEYRKKYGINIIHATDEAWYENNDVCDLSEEAVHQHGSYLIDNYVCPAVESLCKNNDLVIGLESSFQLNTYAEIYQKPYVTVSYQHGLTPTSFRAFTAHQKDEPQSAKEIEESWHSVEKYINEQHSQHINDFRERCGLGPVKNVFRQVTHSATLQIIGVSTFFCKQDPAWGTHRHVCGYLYLEDVLDAAPLSDSLERFLEGAEAPIFFTLGSSNYGQEFDIKNLQAAIDAAGSVNRKVIIQTKKNKLNTDALRTNKDVYLIDGTVDYNSLFPRCSVIIHHGGSGTSHLVLRSGCPSVILESGADTPLWAHELHIAGVAPLNIPLTELNAENLTDRLKLVVGNTEMKERAVAISQIMIHEQGVQNAVSVINRTFAHLA